MLLLPGPVRPAVPDSTIETLRRQVEQLQGQVEYLEQQLRQVIDVINDQSADAGNQTHRTEIKTATPLSPVSPAREISTVTSTENSAISFGGRIKVDAIYNSRSIGGGSGTNSADLTFFPAAVPLTASGESDQISFNARETRLWLKGYNPSDYGEMAGYVEIDFSASASASNEKVSNSYTPRLRHAYGTLGGITAGQTYTTFMNVSAYPEINDLNGPVGIMNIRQPMLRYRFDHDRWGLILALENPETTLVTAAGNRIAPDDDRLPDLVGKLEFEEDWGNWSLSGMARQIRSDGAVLAGINDSVWGGAVSAAGRINIFHRDNLRFNFSYGNALGRYLSFNAYDDGVIDTTGRITLTPVIGGYLAWQHWWSDNLRSTAGAGVASADHSSIVDPGSVNAKLFSTHLNLIWSPSLNASIGIEWLHGYRELENGVDGEIDRIQLTSLYKF